MSGDGDLAGAAMAESARRMAPRACTCGIVDVAPWRGHELPWSPASVVFGAVTVGVAVVAIIAAEVLWVGPAILAVWIVSTAATSALARRRGHRGLCLVRRGTWMGVAAVGVPLRVAAGLPF